MLSDFITRCIERGDREDYERFYEELLRAQLGVIATGVPEGVTGAYRAGEDEVGLGRATTPDGRTMVLACADRAVFVQRFHKRFNAEMGARQLLAVALADPDCEGVLINSAASEHSVPIPRALCEELLAPAPAPVEARPWWKLW